MPKTLGRIGQRADRVDPPEVGVDVEACVANEAEQRHAALASQVDRQAGRSPDGPEHGDAGDRRLLHQLEADPAAQHDDPARQRDAASEQLGTDQLVQGVVAADVLPQREQVAVYIEEIQRRECRQSVQMLDWPARAPAAGRE